MAKPTKPTKAEHRRARQLTEAALEALAKGDERAARKLVVKARQTDPSAIEEVLEDLEEDAASNHGIA